MQLFALGFVLVAASLVALVFALFEPEFSSLRSERMKASDIAALAPGEQATSTPVYDVIDKVLRSTGWKPFTEDQLAQGGIKTGVTQMVAITLLVAVSIFILLLGLSGSFLFALLASVAAPLLVRLYVSRKTTKRREKFNRQMAEAMTLFSSALKSGMNVPTALANTASEMEAPMGEELARIVNESRLGRDLVVGMTETAERMESPDFKWISEAVSIQRDSGGRLSEILDRVIATIAERNELREKINSLAAEGKMSGYVLMALPIAVGGMYTLVNTEYMMLLFTTFMGRILLISATVLYVVGGLWLNQIAKVKL